MRHGPLPLVSLLTLVCVAAVGCGGGPTTGVDDPLPSAVEATAVPGSSGKAPSVPPALASHGPDASVPAAMTQTDTAWGRIWDGLPSAFPVFPGSSASDEAGPDGPVSAVFTAPAGDPAEVAQWLQAELEVATYSTEALSGPLEDGSFVLDSVGEGECRIETTIAPAGDVTLIAVRYGAACPA